MAGQESDDTCEMCGWGERGRWGHTCGSPLFLSFFTLKFSWGVTKGVGLALMAEEKRKEKKKRKRKKREMGWVGLGVGQGANKYIKRIEYI